MLYQTNYLVVDKNLFMTIFNHELWDTFESFVRNNSNVIKLPHGDFVYEIERWVVEDEDFESQEQVFNKCPLEIQNQIYQLKKSQEKEGSGMLCIMI